MQAGANGGRGAAIAAGGSQDERLLQMRKKLRTEQERQRKLADRRKSHERNMAAQWQRHAESEKIAKKEEYQTRMQQLQAQAERRALAEAERPASGRGSKLEDSTDAEEAPFEVPAGPPVRLPSRPPPVARKKRRDPKESVREEPQKGPKSIVQEAQERIQGLYRSTEGREILEAAPRHKRMEREALVRGDHDAVKRAEVEEAMEGAEAQAQEAAEEEHAPPQRHLARRYRLRVMHHLKSQVLHCRTQIASSLASPRSPLGLAPQRVDSPLGLPGEPSRNSWMEACA